MKIRALFSLRRQKAQWLFALGDGLLALLALIGANYGAFIPYAVLAAVCFLQFWRPTLIVWFIVLTLFAAALGVYGFAFLSDAVNLLRDDQTKIFLNPADSAAFTLLFIILITIIIGLIVSRPLPLESRTNEIPSDPDA